MFDKSFARLVLYISVYTLAAVGLVSCFANTAGAPLVIGETPLQTPLPTLGEGTRAWGAYVTPLPDERLQAGPIIELPTQPIALQDNLPVLNYRTETIEVETSPATSPNTYIVVTDLQTGQPIVQLGDSNAYARTLAKLTDFLIWVCGNCPNLDYGMYAYSFATKTNALISPQPADYLKYTKEWLIYAIEQDKPYASLYAYNLETQEVLSVTEEMVVLTSYESGERPPWMYFAVDGTKIVWVMNVASPGEQRAFGLQVYDLEQQTYQTLSLPAPFRGLYRLAFNGSLVVWKTDFWQGYDLSQDAYFTIPIVPPVLVGSLFDDVGAVVPWEGQLYWSITPLGSTERYFTAPVVPVK